MCGLLRSTWVIGADTRIMEQVQHNMAGICEDMCKEVGAYPKCQQYL